MGKTSLLVIGPPDHYALRDLADLREFADITVGADQTELEELAPRAEVILWTGLAGDHVDLPRIWAKTRVLEWIHCLSAGVEKILFPALRESAVPLTNARGVFKRSLAEFAVLGILYHLKKVRRLVDNQRDHRWDDFYVKSADRRVLGVVGYGEIGRECALLCKGIGMQIHAMRRNPEKSAGDGLLDGLFGPQQLHEMLAGIDVLVCAAPLTPETHHLIGAAELDCMKPTAILVNVGRGPVVDEAALIQALERKQISAASLDVFETEPLPAESPLWDLPNVLISPHCTDRTEDPDWLGLSMQCFYENFARYRAARPLENCVDKRAGY
jgi:phosphoglycerate dehydrogenase-like enzyme